MAGAYDEGRNWNQPRLPQVSTALEESDNPYDILGIGHLTLEEGRMYPRKSLIAAYHAASRRTHPDKIRDGTAAEIAKATKQFQKVEAAKSLLDIPVDADGRAPEGWKRHRRDHYARRHLWTSNYFVSLGINVKDEHARKDVMERVRNNPNQRRVMPGSMVLQSWLIRAHNDRDSASSSMCSSANFATPWIPA